MHRKQINIRSKKQEYRVRDIFRKYGWDSERVPASGASNALKGDVIADKTTMPLDGGFHQLKFVVDNKSTDKDTIRIAVEALDKIYIQTQNIETEALLIPGITLTLPRQPVIIIVPHELIRSDSLSAFDIVRNKSFTIDKQGIDFLCNTSYFLYVRTSIIQNWTIGRLDRILEGLE